MSKVEEVARALCAHNIRLMREHDTEASRIEDMMPAAVDHAWRQYVGEARAAIAAMREPSEAMEDAGASGSGEDSYDVARGVWFAMIDAVLQE